MTDINNSNESLIAAVDGAVYPLSNAECVFRASDNGEKHVMTMQVLRALDVCSQFRTFEDHVKALLSSVSELKGREEDVRRVLQALQKRELFVSAKELLDGSDKTEPQQLSGVFIRSDGRATALTALLQSALENEQRFGNRYRYFVVDDAEDDEGADACRQVVEAMRQAGLDCRWLSREWQQAFTERLCDAHPQSRALLEWALLNADPADKFTGGRLRNLITLACAGQPYLLLDDDLVLAPRACEPASRLMLEVEHWELWFHADAPAAAKWGSALDFDPLARHAATLGQPVGAALNALDMLPSSVAGLDQRKLQRILDGPVLSTVSGTYGDAASSTKLWYYNIQGPSRERFWASREAYEQNRDSRFVSRTRRSLTLAANSQFTPVGLAGDHLLPPTLPGGRNEDSLYAATQHCLYPQSRSLEFPWALGHFPEQVRHWSADPWEQALGGNSARFLASILINAKAVAPNGEAGPRYAMLANQLQLIAAGSDAALESRLDEFMMYARADLVAQLQDRLKEASNGPVYWGTDMRRIIEVNGKGMIAKERGRLADMPKDLDTHESTQWLREKLTQYADLLRLWPALWESAQEMDILP